MLQSLIPIIDHSVVEQSIHPCFVELSEDPNVDVRYFAQLSLWACDHDRFQDDSMRIMRDIQKNRESFQILLFSATFNDNVKMFISKMIPNANQVFVKEEDLSLDAIKQYCVKCPSELAKIKVLKDRVFPLAEKLRKTIIFVRTRESASKLNSMLEAEGY